MINKVEIQSNSKDTYKIDIIRRMSGRYLAELNRHFVDVHVLGILTSLELFVACFTKLFVRLTSDLFLQECMNFSALCLRTLKTNII